MQGIKSYFVKALDRDNRIYMFLFGCLPGVLASGTSFMLGIAFVGAILFWALKLFPWCIRADQHRTLLVFSIYPIVIITTFFMNYNSGDDLLRIVTVLPFFAGWFVLARMRMSPDGTLVPNVIFGAGVGMILTLIICTIQLIWFNSRPDAGAGNAAVLGLFAVLCANISLLNARSQSKIERFVAIAGYMAGTAVVIISETRSAWLLIPINLAIVMVYFSKAGTINYKKIAVPVLAVLLVAGAISYPKIESRILKLQQDVELYEKNPHEMTSLGVRMMIWQGGLRAIAEHPLLGYGMQHRMDAVKANMPPQLAKQLTATHLHNGILTAAVDAGIVGVIALLLMLSAPIYAASIKKPGPERDVTMAIAQLLVASYFVTGMFGILFGHDATDAVFITTFLVICHGVGSSRLVSIDEQFSMVRKA